MIKKVSKIFLSLATISLLSPINVYAETINNISLGGNSTTGTGLVMTGNNSTVTYTKNITQTRDISGSIRVARDESEDEGSCSGSSTYGYVRYTATVTQTGKLTYIMPGYTVTAGMSFPLEVYYETEISYDIDIDSVPTFKYGDRYTTRTCSGSGENRKCRSRTRCRQSPTEAVEYASYHTIPNYSSRSKDFYGLNTNYVNSRYTPVLSSIGYGDTSSETARQIAEVDMQKYISQINNTLNNRVKSGLKISFADSNDTDSNYNLQNNQQRYTSWDSCTNLTYTETDGDETHYRSGTWPRNKGWGEGKKAYASCQLAIDNAYIDRTTGDVVYSSNTNNDSNTNYLSAGQVIFTPLDMHTGSFPVTIETSNLSLLPDYFSSSTWSSKDTLNIQVAQKYYNETDDLKSYDGFVFYYRPIALSIKSGGVYSIDPFPSNNYIPANFVKWLYINGDTGNGTNSSAGLLNRNNQYQRNWQRLTQDYLNDNMTQSTAEYYTNLSRTFISTIQKHNDSVSYLNESLRANGYSTFIERYRNYITRNDEPAKLGEVKTDDWQVLTRE